MKSKWSKHLMLGALVEVEPSKKCTRLWCEAPLEVKKVKAPYVRTIFWTLRLRCSKSARVVTRSTFPSKNAKNISGPPEHFLEVEMLKKCTAVWREAHFEVNMYKKLQLRSIFGS